MESLRYTVLLAFAGLLLLTMLYLHPVGFPGDAPMDEYFIRNSQPETGSNNVVTGVLFDYRGLDTLGEASVLFAAASGVMLLFRRKKNE